MGGVMFPKRQAIHSRALRDAANGERCTFNIVGVCSYRNDETVLCHLPDESHGTARKSDDLSAAFGCHDCHAVIDGRQPHEFSPGERDWYMRRAQVRTLRRWIEHGLVSIKGL